MTEVTLYSNEGKKKARQPIFSVNFSNIIANYLRMYKPVRFTQEIFP